MPFHSGENGEMGRMANLIWETLDDMKLDNPDGYRQFMSRHLKEGFEAMSPPRPAMCIKTKVVGISSSALSSSAYIWSLLRKWCQLKGSWHGWIVT